MPKLKTGSVQKAGKAAKGNSAGTPPGYSQNSRAAVDKKFDGHFKSQGKTQKD